MGQLTRHEKFAYDDLELRIERIADGNYRSIATAADGQAERGSFQLPMTQAQLDGLVNLLGLRQSRGPVEDRREAMREIGTNLFDALFAERIGTLYRAARDSATREGRGLRITLQLSGSPELMGLPWELIYSRPRFIAQSMYTPVVRKLDVGSRLPPRRVELPLRILGIVSLPPKYARLNAEFERQNLEEALAPLTREGLVEIDWLERPTLEALEQRVSEPDDLHVIHFIGHGAFNVQNESGILVLEGPDGRPDDVTGEQLGEMLQDEHSLRLVVLNSCEGARTSHIDPFSGVATSLIHFDIPAVIAMQFEITDLAAIAFSKSLYRGLAMGMPIDAAVGPARRAIRAKTETEFGTPVLFLRNGDAQLFEIVGGGRSPGASDQAEPAEPSPFGAIEQAQTDAAIENRGMNAGTAPPHATGRPADGTHGERGPGAAGTAVSNADAGGDTTVESSPRPQDTRAQAPPKIEWRLTLRSIDVQASPTVMTLLLQLDEQHEVILSENWFGVLTAVDGHRVATEIAPHKITVQDGDNTRVCEFAYILRAHSSGRLLTRPTSVQVDGEEIPIDIPGFEGAS